MKKIDKSLISSSVEPESEKVHRITRVFLSSAPLGGALVEIFNSLIEPPMERRRQAWMEQVSDAINKIIENSHVTLEQLTNDDKFIDALFKASSAALRTHKEKKLAWLKNALINSATRSFGIEEKEDVFIRVIDELTVWHIDLLSFYNAPYEFITERDPEGEQSEGMIFYIKRAFPSLSDDYIKMIWSELRSKGLITLESARELRFKRPEKAGEPLELASCTTSIGWELMMFLSEPSAGDYPVVKSIGNEVIKPW